MSLLNTTVVGARAAMRHTARVASGISGRAMVAGSNVTTMGASRVGPVSIPQSALYHDVIIDHYENPRNVGSMEKGSKNVGTGLVGAPACGDVMKFQIEVGDDGKVQDAKFKTFGCGSAIASSSVATEWVKGKSVDECLSVKNSDIASHLKLPPVKLHCSMLAEDAIKAAVKDWNSKNGGESNNQETSAEAQGEKQSQ